MKEIKIISLELNNFKNHDHLRIDFGGANAAIYGDNATGKTSVYDALTWLLFGKNSRGDGDKNFEVKPLGLDGEIKDHDAITEVEAVLSVDGESVSLKRTLREIWATKRGCSVPVFDGNTSEYFVDGVPVKKYAFSDKVSELVSEEVFKLLTSVSHFADGISWQDRRAVLFKAAGIASDREIMAGDARFLPLIEAMGRLELEDYKKKLVAEKRGHVGTRDEIPARISECEKTIEDLEDIDFEAIRCELESLEAQADKINAEILALDHDSATEAKRMDIREVQIALDALEAENKAYRASQTASTVDVGALERKLAELNVKKASKESRTNTYAGQIATYDKDIAASRDRWIQVNSEKFTASACPTCGQALPAAQLKAAEDRFNSHKTLTLHEIEQTANARKKARGQAEEYIAELRVEIEGIDTEIENVSAQISAAKAQTVDVFDLADYESKKAQLTHDLAMLQGELADMATDKVEVRGKLTYSLSLVRSDIAIKRGELGKESMLTYSKSRIESLRADARRASELLEAIDAKLYLIDEYSRYKTQFVEDSVNGLFRIARFRLFREQANGGVEERCDVVLDGVPYTNLNSGARINVGVDIINTLSVIYGVSVPLFVDNAESVTALEPCASQTIRLIVSENDRKLRIEI
jgi:DNA repair exonuclease SbcCD ATPase subunit